MILAKTTLAKDTLPEQVAFVLEQAAVALEAASRDGSQVAAVGLADLTRHLGFIGGDIEVYADREEDVQAMYAEVNAELEGAEDDLPPIIQDEGLEWDIWGEAA